MHRKHRWCSRNKYFMRVGKFINIHPFIDICTRSSFSTNLIYIFWCHIYNSHPVVWFLLLLFRRSKFLLLLFRSPIYRHRSLSLTHLKSSVYPTNTSIEQLIYFETNANNTLVLVPVFLSFIYWRVHKFRILNVNKFRENSWKNGLKRRVCCGKKLKWYREKLTWIHIRRFFFQNSFHHFYYFFSLSLAPNNFFRFFF